MLLKLDAADAEVQVERLRPSSPRPRPRWWSGAQLAQLKAWWLPPRRVTRGKWLGLRRADAKRQQTLFQAELRGTCARADAAVAARDSARPTSAPAACPSPLQQAVQARSRAPGG